jgi:hypothetical protein
MLGTNGCWSTASGLLASEGRAQPTYRGMRINGQRVATWSSQHGMSGSKPKIALLFRLS